MASLRHLLYATHKPSQSPTKRFQWFRFLGDENDERDPSEVGDELLHQMMGLMDL